MADIAGVLMLFKYGLPEFSPMGGTVLLSIGETDKKEVEKERRYRRMSRIALALLVLGFGLQAIPYVFTFLN